MNYEFFPDSRTILSFMTGMILVIVLLLSSLSIIAIIFTYLFRRKPFRIVWQVALSGPAIICIWSLLGAYLPRALPTGSDLLEFDSVIWKIDESEPLPENLVTSRQKMIKDLVENVLTDQARGEIINLLGPSTQTSNFRGMYDLIYVLGPQRDAFFGLDYEWLIIRLRDGKFKNFSIVVD